MVLLSRFYYDTLFPYFTVCKLRTGNLRNAKYLRNTGSVGWVAAWCYTFTHLLTHAPSFPFAPHCPAFSFHKIWVMGPRL